jgi:hypothetical protein
VKILRVDLERRRRKEEKKNKKNKKECLVAAAPPSMAANRRVGAVSDHPGLAGILERRQSLSL